MHTKKIFIVGLAVLFLILNFSGCSKVPAGHVGVKVYLLGGAKGIDHEVLGVGRYWIGWNEELYLFPTFMQNYVWTKNADEGSPNDESITFQSIEGLSFNGDFGVSYYIEPAKIDSVFQTYRRGVEEITDTFLRNQFRDELNSVASTMTSDSIYGRGKKAMMDRVWKNVRNNNKRLGIVVEKFYAIGDFRLPENVKTALNAKIAAIQKSQQRENEVAEARAQAEIAKANAEGTKAKQALEAATLTPLILRKMWIEKWDGKLPNVITGDKASQFLMQLPEK